MAGNTPTTLWKAWHLLHMYLCSFLFLQNQLLPPSERLPPQTTKKPTGPYDKQKLNHHLKKEAVESKVGENYVPFIKKTSQQPEKPTFTAKKPSLKTEFDDMLQFLDENDLAELASMSMISVCNRLAAMIRSCRYMCIISYSGLPSLRWPLANLGYHRLCAPLQMHIIVHTDTYMYMYRGLYTACTCTCTT